MARGTVQAAADVEATTGHHNPGRDTLGLHNQLSECVGVVLLCCGKAWNTRVPVVIARLLDVAPFNKAPLQSSLRGTQEEDEDVPPLPQAYGPYKPTAGAASSMVPTALPSDHSEPSPDPGQTRFQDQSLRVIKVREEEKIWTRPQAGRQAGHVLGAADEHGVVRRRGPKECIQCHCGVYTPLSLVTNRTARRVVHRPSWGLCPNQPPLGSSMLVLHVSLAHIYHVNHAGTAPL